MKFLNRTSEISRLEAVIKEASSALIVIWGRRRVGKTRLLLEWLKQHQGLYWVADESASTIQRRYFALTVEQRLPGFGQVEYPDWGTLFDRLGKEAKAMGWRGPLVIDEFPYLTMAAPELPSILQRFIDHEASAAGLILAISGSSQRMMQGLVLDANEPLYGRAKEIIKLGPLHPFYLEQALNLKDAKEIVKTYSVWGGVPRYWQLAARYGNNTLEAVEALVLDPLGPLHEEPQHLLLEEAPPAMGLRPLLDVIGFGVHRASEIASRVGQPITSLTRSLERLRDLELIEREIPFGTVEKSTKRALYKIKDPFLSFWFGVVAPRRSALTQVGKKARLTWLQETLPMIYAKNWEALCRMAVPHLSEKLNGVLFEPAQRFWHGQGPEWDVVAESFDKQTLLLGEVKWIEQVPSVQFLQKTLSDLLAKGKPTSSAKAVVLYYVLFVPEKPTTQLNFPENVYVLDAEDVIFCVDNKK